MPMEFYAVLCVLHMKSYGFQYKVKIIEMFRIESSLLLNSLLHITRRTNKKSTEGGKRLKYL